MTLFAVLMEASRDPVIRPAIAELCCLVFQYLVTKVIKTDQSQQRHIQQVLSARKHTSAKHGKTLNGCLARENIQRVACAGKHTTGA